MDNSVQLIVEDSHVFLEHNVYSRLFMDPLDFFLVGKFIPKIQFFRFLPTFLKLQM